MMIVISSLNLKLKEVRTEHEQLSKSVKMLNSSINDLNQILNNGKSSSNKHGLDYSSLGQVCNQKNSIVFVPTKAKRSVEENIVEVVENSLNFKSKIWICYYCGRRGHIKPFFRKRERDMIYPRRSCTNQGPIIFIIKLSQLFTSQEVLRGCGELNNPLSTVMLSSLQFKHPLKIGILIAAVQVI